MKRRNLFSLIFIAATLGLIVVLVFSTGELSGAWSALTRIDIRWALAALLAIVCNVLFDALCLFYFLRKQKHGIALRTAAYVSLIGLYYSNITPGASGGQPMQVYHMSKHGVPVAIGTSAISIRFFAMELTLVVSATLLWALHPGFVDAQLGAVKWVVYIGYGLNFLAIPLILLVALHRPLVDAVITFAINLLARVRLVKRPQERLLHIRAGMDTYHASILRLAKHPSQIVLMLVLAALSSLGLMAVPVCVYYAFGLSGTPWGQLLTASYLLFMSASYTPLPGASGAQEGGFLVFFRGLFPQSVIGVAILVWRFFTFYLFLIIGAVMSIVNNLRENRRRAREEAAVPPASEDAAASPAPEA
jgi:hypothetical protein